jgi:biotin carboxyl carrier protein
MKLRVKIDDQTYEVEVGDLNARPILASVDGEALEVWPEEIQAAPVVAAAVQPAASAPLATAPAPRPAPAANVDRGKAVVAPIPGTIVAIHVKEGDSVNAGQELIALEAMKMKNLIRATRAGKIGRIMVKTGDRVPQGQPLVEYAD